MSAGRQRRRYPAAERHRDHVDVRRRLGLDHGVLGLKARAFRVWDAAKIEPALLVAHLGQVGRLSPWNYESEGPRAGVAEERSAGASAPVD